MGKIPNLSIHLGECLDVLQDIPRASMDAVVTDPPYGLVELTPTRVTQAMAAWLAGDRTHVPDGRGILGRDWDSFVPPPGVWDQCLRALKPGGHLLAFAGARTWDLMTLSIRLAGFEIRDTLKWVYGSGKPQSTALLKPAWEPVIIARRPLDGTLGRNQAQYGTGALNTDSCRVPGKSPGRWPTNLVLTHLPECVEGQECGPGCAVAELDQQSGTLTSGSRKAGTYGLMGYMGAGDAPMPAVNGDSGGASRFFPTFRYQAKAPSRERPRLEDGTTWPTIKPLALMRWLVRLATPPGGTVLDPFAGTGTTAEACALEGLGCVLIERDPTAIELTNIRMAKYLAA